MNFTVTVGMKGCVIFIGLKHKSELAVNTRPPSMKWDMAGHRIGLVLTIFQYCSGVTVTQSQNSKLGRKTPVGQDPPALTIRPSQSRTAPGGAGYR
jgi:hypothetical protein